MRCSLELGRLCKMDEVLCPVAGCDERARVSGAICKRSAGDLLVLLEVLLLLRMCMLLGKRGRAGNWRWQRIEGLTSCILRRNGMVVYGMKRRRLGRGRVVNVLGGRRRELLGGKVVVEVMGRDVLGHSRLFMGLHKIRAMTEDDRAVADIRSKSLGALVAEESPRCLAVIGVLCLALLDARGCPCRWIACALASTRCLVVRRRDLGKATFP